MSATVAPALADVHAPRTVAVTGAATAVALAVTLAAGAVAAG